MVQFSNRDSKQIEQAILIYLRDLDFRWSTVIISSKRSETRKKTEKC